MLLYLIAWLGGVLAVASPCVLPVLPFVLTRAGQPFRRSGLPLLVGMALTFTALAILATAAGQWMARANQIGRVAAMIIFAFLGFTLVVPRVADELFRPLVRLGELGDGLSVWEARAGVGRSILFGASTGLLWAPCAGPVLGLILTGAAVNGASWRSVGLLASFA